MGDLKVTDYVCDAAPPPFPSNPYLFRPQHQTSSPFPFFSPSEKYTEFERPENDEISLQRAAILPDCKRRRSPLPRQHRPAPLSRCLSPLSQRFSSSSSTCSASRWACWVMISSRSFASSRERRPTSVTSLWPVFGSSPFSCSLRAFVSSPRPLSPNSLQSARSS